MKDNIMMEAIYDVSKEQYIYIRKKLSGIVFFWDDQKEYQVKTASPKWKNKIEDYLNNSKEIKPWE